MLHSVEGVYRDGKVELAEKPERITEAKVLVTFLEPGTIDLRTASALACCSSSSCLRRETTMDLPPSLYSMIRNV